jgi:UDP-N-acetylglucosamine transferase subunit ALG13
MKRVLVAPLDWGLGHASRCIPVIRKLIGRHCEVMIAGSGDSLSLLQAEFPALRSLQLPPYKPVYPKRGSMAWKMATQLPHFIRTIRDEHEVIEKRVAQEQLDLVISDNRYGCWSRQVPSVFITHQSNIMMPQRFGWLQGAVRRMNLRYMRKFTRCWIPDLPEKPNLAGDLISFGKDGASLNIDHIGPLSRFESRPDRGSPEMKYDVTAILSGPEPQRTILEDTVLPQLRASGLKYFVVRGVFSPDQLPEAGHVNFLTSHDLQQVIESSACILARSGYSTVMDMAALRKKVIFIPTPGQTEQQYLAQQLTARGIAYSTSQDDFNLADALEKAGKYYGFTSMPISHNALDRALDVILSA